VPPVDSPDVKDERMRRSRSKSKRDRQRMTNRQAAVILVCYGRQAAEEGVRKPNGCTWERRINSDCQVLTPLFVLRIAHAQFMRTGLHVM
jgi:hypothetical protein